LPRCVCLLLRETARARIVEQVGIGERAGVSACRMWKDTGAQRREG
jgi:hypothetical protein